MHPREHTATVVVLVSALVAGCGGGGSDSTTPATAAGCPGQSSASAPVASYAGTYTCAGPDVAFTAVLPAATGGFSNCSGSALNGQLAVSCQGSIASDGTFNVTGHDGEGNALSFNGTATATAVCGSETSLAGLNTFHCQH